MDEPRRGEAGMPWHDPSATDPGVEDTLGLLRGGRLDILGRLLTASNATLYCRLSPPGSPPPEPAGGRDPADAAASGDAERSHPGRGAGRRGRGRRGGPAPDPGPTGGATTAPDEVGIVACVYKPIRGERPLSDFPRGTLAFREVAAYEVSRASGWDVVPPTVLRDGPLGRGMVQLWVDVDESVDVVELVRTASPRLRGMALFDAVINNGDRKGGHLLPVPGGHIHGVDHGVSFSVSPKLRTVLWAWRGQELRSDERRHLEQIRTALDAELGARLRKLLSPAEVEATIRRVDRLLATCRFPHPSPDWPAVPWPPF